MALRSILSAVAWVEIALVVLILISVAIGFGAAESEDVLALALSAVILAAPPVAALVANGSNAVYRTALAAVLVVAWLPLVWWVLVYA